VLHDLLAICCCSLDVRVELLDVCLELLDAGSLRGVGLSRGIARRRRRELRLELGHALGERTRACWLKRSLLAVSSRRAERSAMRASSALGI
jgi:hypothetical protein